MTGRVTIVRRSTCSEKIVTRIGANATFHLPGVTGKVTIVTYLVTGAKPDGIARLLFGAVRRDVLALLYGRPEERFYLREIQRFVGAGIGPVQRELKQLTQAGL